MKAWRIGYAVVGIHGDTITHGDRYLLAVAPAAVVQFDCFHRDLNEEKLEISAVPAVSSMLCTHSEAVRDITHTVTLVHRDIHTLEHATKHTAPHKCTHEHKHTPTCSLWWVCITLSHMHFCMQQWDIFYASSDDLSNCYLSVKTGLKATLKPLRLFFYKMSFVRTVSVIADFTVSGHLLRELKLCEWDCCCETASFVQL